ncbi:sigma-54-dependent transcriptional regulator [Bdellovibrio sp. HCB2-146]|uniref:sigma-54-dependent transcriptional regulator n=1 Tax=Bdellovibrio sp. HCB2-146 TaxID=3394362 RepID=UPI0039BCC234
MTPKLLTLIVDDEAELRRSVISILQSAMPDVEFTIEEASTGKEALQKVQQQQFDLVLMDVKMPEMNGIEALTAIKEHDPRTFVVLMTAHSNLHDAVIAIKEGAYDYVEKPVNPQQLTEIVRQSLEARELVSNLALSNPIFDDDIESEFVGSNSKMKEVFNLIYRLCKVDTTVLIRGENGTGKELVARAIHFNSPRKSGGFVAINCGAIPESLMESELFGHEKGAFTGAVERKIGKFQMANNGTLFLDELGELKPDMQVKLLRVLQDKKFTPVGGTREVKTNTRIIAATNRNLEKMMEEGQFREDLFYRLNVMPIFLPPLRERTDDIKALVQTFIKKFSKQHGRVINGITAEALDMLKSYRWPGNIRELENAVERAFIVENSHEITVESLPESIKLAPKEDKEKMASVGYQGPLDFDAFKEEMEKEFIVSALKANQGRINQTVAQANIPKNTLLRKIRKYGINVKDYAGED